MNKIDKLIGPKFKKIRKRSNISLKKLCIDVPITSTSVLSRWERGEEYLPIEIFDKLLDYFHISYFEIGTSEKELKSVIQKISILYQENNIQKLHDFSQDLLNKYLNENNNNKFVKLELLFKSAMANNYYLDLSGNDLTNRDYKLSLLNQIAKINNWLDKEVILFANVQLLLDPTAVYKLSRSLLSKMYEDNIVSLNESIAILNAVFVLIKKKEVTKAEKLLSIIKKINFDDNDLLVKIRIQFVEQLINYLNTRDKDKILNFLFMIKEVFDQQLYSDFMFTFQQIKEIYDN